MLREWEIAAFQRRKIHRSSREFLILNPKNMYEKPA